MLKIKTSSGYLKLPTDIEIPLTITNPMFKDRGSFSLPFSLPIKPNRKYINVSNPHLKNLTSFLEDVEITHTNFNEKGRLQTMDSDIKNVEVSLTTKEGAFWEWAKNKKLGELTFPNGDPFTGTIEQKYTQWETRLNDATEKVWPQEFFNIFPVVVGWDVDTENQIVGARGTGISKFRLLNPIVPPTEEFNYMALNRFSYISPFLYYNAIFSLIASTYGLKIVNELETIPEFNRACLINNSTWPLLNGVLNWQELVPDLSIMEFIENVESMFGVTFFIDKKTLRIKIIDTILQKERIKKVNGKVNIISSEPKQIHLENDNAGGEYDTVIDQTDEYLQNTIYTYEEGDFPLINNLILAEVDEPYWLSQRLTYIKSTENYFLKKFTREEENETWKFTSFFKGNRLRNYTPESDLTIKKYSSKICVIPSIRVMIEFYLEYLPGHEFISYYALPHLYTELKDFENDNYDGSIYNYEVTFPLNICIYRGKCKNKTNEGYEHYFPLASSFTYNLENEPLNNLPEDQNQLYADTFTLIKQGNAPDNYGVYDRFWKRIEQLYLTSAKQVEITNFDTKEILKNDIWDVLDIDGNHVIITEMELNLKLNSIEITSIKGITTKPYS